MLTLPMLRWVGLRPLRSPTAWGAALLLLGWVPLVKALTPWHGLESPTSLALAWSLPVGAAGAVAGLQVLSTYERFLELLPPTSRWTSRWGGVACMSLWPLIPLWVGAAWVGARPTGLDLAALALVGLHQGVLGAWLLRWPAPGRLRILGFLGLIWVIPDLVREISVVGRWILPIAEAGAPLSGPQSFDGRGSAAWQVLAVVCALGLAGYAASLPLSSPSSSR